MPINIKNMSGVFGKDVFTTKGIFAGRVADMRVNLGKFRINSLVLDVGKASFLSGLIGNKRGVVVPYQYVENVGDVVLIKHISPHSAQMPEVKEEEPASPFSMF
jgi:sporulation protein YlmC with PRC-barrel domain